MSRYVFVLARFITTALAKVIFYRFVRNIVVYHKMTIPTRDKNLLGIIFYGFWCSDIGFIKLAWI